MAAYLVRRLVFGVFLVLAVSSGSLVLTRLAPGDFVTDSLGVAGSVRATEEARARYGLNRPLGEQYREWLLNALRLDFGRSLAYDRPVVDLVPERAANTLLVAVAALTLATLLGISLGTISGSRSGGAVTGVVRALSLVLLSTPPLIMSLFLVFLAAQTGWLPIGGMRSATATSTDALDVFRHMVVPVLALALPIAAMFERLQSQALRETIGQPFILVTRARGIPERQVVWRDAFKAAVRPVASVYGVVAGSLLSGSFAVEMITAWPGLGRLTLDALRMRDPYLVAGCAGAGAAFLAVSTFLSDAALAVADPRSRE